MFSTSAFRTAKDFGRKMLFLDDAIAIKSSMFTSRPIPIQYTVTPASLRPLDAIARGSKGPRSIVC